MRRHGAGLVCAVALALALACGCADDTMVVDARRDAGVPTDGWTPPDGGGSDGGGTGSDGGGTGSDGGGADGGGTGSDGGCGPPAPDPWEPVDTGGPEGESLSACIDRVGSLTDDRLPMGQQWVLTTFGGAGDVQPVSCSGAPDADGSWHYAANAQRYRCGQHVRLVDSARERCVVVEVADVGPNACVEEAAQMPVFDVSPASAEPLVGARSVGYSEDRRVLGAPVGSDNPRGPCNHLDDPAARLLGFVGGPCERDADCSFDGAFCLTEADGYPGGHCTTECTSICPDRPGPFAYTGCAQLEKGGLTACLARCDFTLFETGCRAGYGCVTAEHPQGTGPDRDVCLPLVCR